jgi:ribonucleoside-triphosphate reductase
MIERNNQHEKMGKGIKFERIRRITGYLVGSLDTWNNAKKAEEKDRVKHRFTVKKKED